MARSHAMAGVSYKYVTFRKPGNSSRMAPGFYMQCRGVWAGPFADQEQAARKAATVLKVPVSNLVKRPKVIGAKAIGSKVVGSKVTGSTVRQSAAQRSKGWLCMCPDR